jgi:hypothetical protein
MKTEEPTVVLDLILNGKPTWDQSRAFWRDGEFHDEHYLVTAIRRHLLTEAQRQEMHDRRVSIEDLLNGRCTDEHEPFASAVFAAWNQKLGFSSFG